MSLAVGTMTYKALDTETLNGYARIIAINDEWVYIKNFYDIMDWLMQKKHRSIIYWTWNLRYDSQAILKHLLKRIDDRGQDWRKAAADIMSYKGFRFRYKDWNFTFNYLEKKRLKLTVKPPYNKSGWTIKLYDIAQFYYWSGLEAMGQKYLNKGKDDCAEWVKHSILYGEGEHTKEWMEQYLQDNKNDIGKYCRKDALLTYWLAGFMEQSFIDLELPFRNPLSQAKISEHAIKDYCLNVGTQYPAIIDKIKRHHEIAKLTYHGGIFETLQRGLFEQPIYNYDINSAYPTTLATLPHWANGWFKPIDKPENNYYGWYLCDFNCKWIPYDDYTSPYKITWQFEGGESTGTVNPKRVIYPTGFRRQFVTAVEYRWMIKNDYPCKFIKGIEWVQQSKKYKSPFGWVPEFYEKRREIKAQDPDDLRQMALKITYNSAYGKTAQSKTGQGTLTNFFYASYITAETRLKLADIVHRYPDDVIELATDGIYMTRNIDNELELGTSLGEWEKTVYDKMLILGSGMKQLWKDDKYQTLARGVTNNRNWNMLEALQENRDKTYLEFTKRRPIHLKECMLHHNVLGLHDLNEFQKVSKKLDANTDKKHVWSAEYENFGDMLEKQTQAEPLIIGYHVGYR